MASPFLKTTAIVVVSALAGIIIFVLAVVGVVYYKSKHNGIEQSTLYHDPEQHKAFMAALKEYQIPFRVGAGGAVFYQLQYKEQVAKVSEALNDNYGPEYSVIEVALAQLDAAKADFKKHGVDFTVLNLEHGYMIRWGRKDNSKVREFLDAAPYYNQGTPNE